MACQARLTQGRDRIGAVFEKTASGRDPVAALPYDDLMVTDPACAYTRLSDRLWSVLRPLVPSST